MSNNKNTKRRLNYRNIALFSVAALLAVTVLVLLIIVSTGKKPGGAISETSSSRVSSESLSSSSESESSSDSVSSSSSSSRILSSSAGSGAYSVDTTGKTVRNAFDDNGVLDLLFPVGIKYPVTGKFSVKNTEEVGGGFVMDSRAAPYCRQMLAAMKSELNSAICPFSTLRTYSHQQNNFKRKMNQYIDKGYSEDEAYKIAATIVAIPGTSEHQIGLAIDVYLYSLYNRDNELNDSFEDTPEFEWLQKHASEYGFILSFPKEKTESTGIIYEPWHYRFVGLDNAAAIKKSGLTLAEWLEEQNIVYVYNAD